MKLRKTLSFLLSVIMVFTLVSGVIGASAGEVATKKAVLSQDTFILGEQTLVLVAAYEGTTAINNLKFTIKDAKGVTLSTATCLNSGNFAYAIIPAFQLPGLTKLYVSAVSAADGTAVLENYEIEVSVKYSVPTNNVTVSDNATVKSEATRSTINIATYAGIFAITIPVGGVSAKVEKVETGKYNTEPVIYEKVTISIPDTLEDEFDITIRVPANTTLKTNKKLVNLPANMSTVITGFPFGSSIEAVVNATENGLATYLMISTETTHVWGEYKYDENAHWRVCDGCGEKDEVAAHEFNSKGACKLCKYKLSDTQYTLSFDTDGGTKYNSLTREKGKKLNITELVPAKAGYTFGGWYYDKTFTKKADVVELNADTTVYAKWTLTEIPFNDVYTTDWYAEDVLYVYNNGIMGGTADKTFAPASGATRGQIATMIWRLEGEPKAQKASSFTDVPANSYYAEAIAWAAEKGIVTGTSATTFSPDAEITREQLVTILYRYAVKKGVDATAGDDVDALSFADAASISDYAVRAIKWACGTSLIQGDDAHNVLPKNVASRAQVAAMIHRVAELVK